MNVANTTKMTMKFALPSALGSIIDDECRATSRRHLYSFVHVDLQTPKSPATK